MIKNCISVTSHAIDPPTPCQKLSHLLGPPLPSSVTYFMDGPIGLNPGGREPPDFGMGVVGSCGLREILLYPIMYRDMR